MNEIKYLTLLELRSLYGINKFLHTKDKKYKKRYITLAVVWGILIAMIFFYVASLVYGLCALGLSDIVPAYLTMISAVIILAFGIFKAGSTIFSPKGYDLLSSMPLHASSIVLSRFLLLYIEDLLFTLVIFLPGTITYSLCTRPGFLFYLLTIPGILLLPALPLVLSVLFGTLVTAVSSRMKYKSLTQTILTIAFVVIVLLGSFTMGNTAENLTTEFLTDLAAAFGNIVTKFYPPAGWFGKAVLQNSIPHFLLYLAVSVLPVLLTLFLVSRNYHRISRNLLTTAAKHTYQMETLETRTLLKSLYLRELKRYFSSSIYVTNTIVGPIMGCIFAASILITGLDTITQTFPMDVTPFLPYVLAAIFSMMPTTTVSISMEGKNFWLLQALPIPTKPLFDSKILLNLTLMFPFYLLSEILLLFALNPTFPEFLCLLLIPGLIILFSVVFGITINIKLHNFDWEKEEAIVKQSASAGIGGFVGCILSAVLAVVVFITPASYTIPVQILLCILLFLATVFLYRKNNTIQLQTL